VGIERLALVFCELDLHLRMSPAGSVEGLATGMNRNVVCEPISWLSMK